ncbi:MAG: LytTR family DNA-binding domain-containing protein [Chitinophagaceae bacterium]
MFRAVLVDDEPQSCKSLAIKLRTVAEDIEIVGIYNHPEKAITGIRKMKPTVVFLDIEMPGMNGFQLLENMEEFDFEVIFVTAYNEYMLNALRISALDYLLKPVDTDELKNALSRLRKKISLSEDFVHTKEQLILLSDTLKEPHAPKRLALATLQGIIFLRINEILRVEALSNYSTFYLVNKQKIVVSKTLKEFEPVLLTQNFFRVNRSCIVNTDCIVKYKHEDGGMLELQDGSEVRVGPHRKNELVELLSRI